MVAVAAAAAMHRLTYHDDSDRDRDPGRHAQCLGFRASVLATVSAGPGRPGAGVTQADSEGRGRTGKSEVVTLADDSDANRGL